MALPLVGRDSVLRFDDPAILFGTEIVHAPVAPKHGARMHHVGAKMLPGISVGYVLHAEGGWIGDLLLGRSGNL